MDFRESILQENKKANVANTFCGRTLMDKIASIDVYNPTEENVVNAVRKYVQQETAFFPKTLKYHIEFVPSNVDVSTKNEVNVIDGSGNVKITLYDGTFNLPFLIRDSSIIPFDVIQNKSGTVPYSRENLAKILMYIDKQNCDKENGIDGGAYEEVADINSNESTEGFLGNILQMRNMAYNAKNIGNGELLVRTADEILDTLEKVAIFSKAQEETMKQVLTEHYTKEYIDKISKLAEEDNSWIEKRASELFEAVDKTRYKSIYDFKHGTIIEFPQRDGDSITNVKAIVFKNLEDVKIKSDGPNPIKLAEENNKNTVVVVTETGDYIVLKNKAPFFAIDLGEEEPFTLGLRKFVDCKENDRVIVLDADKTFYPIFITNTEDNTDESFREEIIINDLNNASATSNLGIYDLIRKRYRLIDALNEFNWSSEYVAICIEDNSNRGKFEKANKVDIINTIRHSGKFDFLGDRKDNIINIITWRTPKEAMICNQNTNCIILRDEIKSYLTSPQEFKFYGVDENTEIFKKASLNNNFVSLKLRNADDNKFDLVIKWRNNAGQQNKKFENIGEGQVKGVLRAGGIDYGEILAFIYKAKIDKQADMSLPEDSTPDNITGGEVPSLVSKAITSIKNNIFNKKIANTVANEIVANQVGDLVFRAGPAAMDALHAIKAYASESEELARRFEKYAMDNESKSMLNIAKIMLITNKFEKIAEDTLKDNKERMFVKEAAQKVCDNKDLLEEVFEDLVMLKVAQIENKNEIVGMGEIGSAIRNIDRLYKIASVIK